MKILVTGSTGFVGSKICQALAQKGYDVVAFHRASSSLKGLEGLAVEHATGDLTQPETLVKAMQGIEVVFHAAALLGGRPAGLEKHLQVTSEGTANVLRAAVQAGVKKFIHTSSVAALGVPKQGSPRIKNREPLLMDENHTWDFPPAKWPYGYAKYLAELEVQKAVAEGLDAVIVNPSVILGAGDVYRTDNSIITQVARRRIPGRIGGGLNVVHIDDVIAGHLAAWEKGVRGERYILATDNLTISAFLDLAAEVCGVSVPKWVIPDGLLRMLGKSLGVFKALDLSPEMFNLAGSYFYYDNTKARRELGLNELKTTRQALIDTRDWFKEQKVID